MLSIYSHKAIAFALSFLYLAIMLKPLVPVAQYTANYGVYSNELCENKSKPELHCNGTCQLSKMLADMESPKDLPTTIPAYEGLQWYIGFVDTYHSDFSATTSTIIHNSIYRDFHSTSSVEINTPPPQLLA